MFIAEFNYFWHTSKMFSQNGHSIAESFCVVEKAKLCAVIICKWYMSYGNIIISEQPLFRTISERRQSRKAFVENPVEIRNCFTAVKGEKPQSDAACFQLSNDLQDRGQ